MRYLQITRLQITSKFGVQLVQNYTIMYQILDDIFNQLILEFFGGWPFIYILYHVQLYFDIKKKKLSLDLFSSEKS